MSPRAALIPETILMQTFLWVELENGVTAAAIAMAVVAWGFVIQGSMAASEARRQGNTVGCIVKTQV